MSRPFHRLVALTLGLGLTGLATAGPGPANPPPPARWGSPAQPIAGVQPVSFQQAAPAPAAVIERPVALPVPQPLPNPAHDPGLQPARFLPTGNEPNTKPPLMRPDAGDLSPGMFTWKQTPEAGDAKDAATIGTFPRPTGAGTPLPLPLGPGAGGTPLPANPVSSNPVIGTPLPMPGAPAVGVPGPVVSTPFPAPGVVPGGPIVAPGQVVGHPVTSGPPGVPSAVPCPPGQPCPPTPCPPGVACPGPVAMQRVCPMPSIVDGADECYTPWSTFYVSGEYLLWWAKGADTPALASTGPATAAIPGVLGDPTTTVLFGGQSLLDDTRSGYRISSGFWFDQARCFGVDGNYLYLNKTTERFTSASSGVPELARPFFNALRGREDTQVVASTRTPAAGFVDISTSSELWGAETNFRTNLMCGSGCFVDLLLGWRTLTLQDRFEYTELISSRIAAAPGSFLHRDIFQSKNTFHGGNIGLVGEHRFADRWTFGWSAKVAMGNTRQQVDIFGATQITGSNGFDGLYQGGILAQRTNIGTHTKDVFAVVPEVSVNLGYDWTPNIRSFVGYNFLYWSNVARATEQINRNINPNLFAPETVPFAGPNEPSFSWRNTGYWAQGVNFGLEFRW